MRPHPSKDFALWLDHSGNFLRFRDDWEEVFQNGVQVLDNDGEKAKKEPTERLKKEAKCPACSFLLPKNTDCCPSCGHIRQRRSEIAAVAGTMEELAMETVKVKKDDKQLFYSELLYVAKERGYNEYWASHKYKEKFKVWPRGLEDKTRPPSLSTMGWIKSRNIAWSNRKEKLAA
jgi:hypothetical protein